MTAEILFFILHIACIILYVMYGILYLFTRNIGYVLRRTLITVVVCLALLANAIGCAAAYFADPLWYNFRLIILETLLVFAGRLVVYYHISKILVGGDNYSDKEKHNRYT